MGSVNRLVGDRVGIVNRLVRNTLAISDETSVSWPITVITGSAGSGKTRIVQEVYEWAVSSFVDRCFVGQAAAAV